MWRGHSCPRTLTMSKNQKSQIWLKKHAAVLVVRGRAQECPRHTEFPIYFTVTVSN